MNLILHIFRKDARHLYPEILITLALTIAFAWAAPVQWQPNAFFSGGGRSGIVYLLAPLLRIQLPIMWLVLISRLVHDESLVGDRQFWITRPYTWTTLLASKLLFLATFLYLPFILMQLYLLHHAGLAIVPALPDLLHYEIRLSVIFLLPVLAIAAVTATFARLALSALVALPYLIAVFLLGGQLLDRRMPTPYLNTLCEIFFFVTLLAVLLFQYATRRTRVARFTLAALPILLLVIVLLAPATALIHEAFPALPQASSPHLVFSPDPTRQEPGTGPAPALDDTVHLNLPLESTGIPPGVRYKATGLALTIDTPQGFHWSSPFLDNGTDLNADRPNANIDFSLPASVFRQIHNIPANLHFQIAAAIYTTGVPQTVAAASPVFAVPGRGVCSLTTEGQTSSCRYALRLPAPIDVTTEVVARPCDLDPTPLSTSVPTRSSLARSFIGSDDTDHLALDFDPVTTSPLSLILPTSVPNNMVSGYLCPGAPIIATPHFLSSHARIFFDVSNLILDPYAKRQLIPSHRTVIE